MNGAMAEMNDGFGEISFGERLRSLREQAGMTVEQIARESKIALRYARALEGGDWRVFSAKIYAQGTMRRVAQVMKISDADAWIATAGREWEVANGIANGAVNITPRAVARPHRIMLTPRRLGAIAAVGMAGALVLFIGARLIAFTAAPGLVIDSPADRSGFAGSIVDVSGKTEKESSLTVNGREITLDERGNFREKIELPPGAVALHFVSRNRFGKTQTVVRNILME